MQAKLTDGSIHWLRYRGDLLRDNNATTHKAIVSLQIIDVEKTLEARFELEHSKVKGDESFLISYVISDLTADTILQHEIFFDDDYSMNKIGAYSQVLSGFSPLIYAADRKRFMELHDRKKLLASYKQGQTTFTKEHRLLSPSGKLLWSRNVLNLLTDPKTQHIILYDYTYDITDSKTYEEVMNTAARDTYKSLTSLDLKTGEATIVFGNVTHPGFTIGKVVSYDELVQNYRFISQDKQQREKLTKERSFASIKKELSTKDRVDYIDTFTDAKGNISVEKTVYYCYDKERGKCIIVKTDETSAFEHEEKQRAELQKAMDEANQANKAKTDFLSRMSHDMRTPMNAIIGLTALTIDDKNNPQAVQNNMTKMRSSSDFLLGLLNDILDMAKIEDGSVTLNSEPYAYNDFIMNIQTLFMPLCTKKNLAFIVNGLNTNPVISTDKIRFNQIFFNVISNAVKYTPAGGKIEYFLRNLVFEGNQLSLDFVIQDNGIGMSAEYISHVFDPFSQENTAITTELQGSGLGLSITKQLVELMGGTIQIDSKKGKGTTVTIHLSFECLSKDQKIQPKIDVPVVEHDFTGKNILLVEDHPLNAQIATRLLEKKGMVVSYAENGRIAVEKFEAAYENAFDAVLMDIRMPEMDGLEASASIRALHRQDAKTIPIIALSANAYTDDVQKSLNAGMNEHLAKPIEPTKLYKALAKYI